MQINPKRRESNYDPMAAGARCDLCPLRGKKVVPPLGPLDAEIVLVGEGPGYVEVERGEPFVGPSGAALGEIFFELGFSKSRAWITNAVLCRAEIPGAEGKERYDFKSYLAWIRKENARRKKAAKANKEPDPDPILTPLQCCAPRLWRELLWFEDVAVKRGQPNGAVVMPLGNFALLAVTGKQGIMKSRGSPIPINLGGGTQ